MLSRSVITIPKDIATNQIAKEQRSCSVLSNFIPARNRHFKNFIDKLEEIKTRFTEEELTEESDADLLQNVDAEIISECIRQSTRQWSSNCRHMLKANLSISNDIDRFDYPSLTSSSNDALVLQKEIAFKSFEFLSADKCSLSIENVRCWGKTDLSPIILKSGDIMDHFPCTHAGSFNGLSTFCFPHGLSIRIIPKCTVERAKNLAWVGRKADRYQLHAVRFVISNVINA